MVTGSAGTQGVKGAGGSVTLLATERRPPDTETPLGKMADDPNAVAEICRDLAVEEQAYRHLLVEGVATPLAHLTGMIISAVGHERRVLQERLTKDILLLAVELCGPSMETRATLYRLRGSRLVRCAWIGPGCDGPPTAFVDGAAEPATALHRLVRDDEVLLIRDTNGHDAAGGPWPIDCEYATRLAVPVSAGQKHLGVLIIDARRPGTISTDLSVPLATLLAKQLAVGLA